jgi:hypothetical protein
LSNESRREGLGFRRELVETGKKERREGERERANREEGDRDR